MGGGHRAGALVSCRGRSNRVCLRVVRLLPHLRARRSIDDAHLVGRGTLPFRSLSRLSLPLARAGTDTYAPVLRIVAVLGLIRPLVGPRLTVVGRLAVGTGGLQPSIRFAMAGISLPIETTTRTSPCSLASDFAVVLGQSCCQERCGHQRRFRMYLDCITSVMINRLVYGWKLIGNFHGKNSLPVLQRGKG